MYEIMQVYLRHYLYCLFKLFTCFSFFYPPRTSWKLWWRPARRSRSSPLRWSLCGTAAQVLSTLWKTSRNSWGWATRLVWSSGQLWGWLSGPDVSDGCLVCNMSFPCHFMVWSWVLYPQPAVSWKCVAHVVSLPWFLFIYLFVSLGNHNLLLRKLLFGRRRAGSEVPWLEGKLNQKLNILLSIHNVSHFN